MKTFLSVSRRLVVNMMRTLVQAVALIALGASVANAAGLLTPTAEQAKSIDLTRHHVDVVIEAGYAITTIEQVFSNPHEEVLEALYTFPVPDGAAIGEFTYWIDGKPVTGEVFEKEQAKTIYKEEKSHGRDTALSEQDAHRRFETRVYPVPANDSVRIRLVYMQAVEIDLGVGRYVYPLEEGGVDEQAMSFWTYNDKVSASFRFRLSMRSPYPIDEFRLPKHPHAQIQQVSPTLWSVELSNEQVVTEENQPASHSSVFQLNQDIVVYWRHQQGLPGSVDMVTYRPEGSYRGTFMMTLTPGDDLPVVTSGRDWVFVLDVSGSMNGKYQSLVEGVHQGLRKLNENDRFRLFVFNNAVRELTPGYVPVNMNNIDTYSNSLLSITPNNGTNLYAAVQDGLKGLDSDRPSALVLVSDGEANVGVTEKKRFLELLESHDVRLFSFIMGNSANRPLLNGMAKASNGFAMSVSNSDDIVGRLAQTTAKLTHQAYRDLSIDFGHMKVGDISPKHIHTLYRGQQLILLGHYWGDGDTPIIIKGRIGAEKKRYETTLNFPEIDTGHPELERLWAFASVNALQEHIDYLGQDADTRQAIVDIALEYGLVTNYTSMLVMSEEQFAARGIERKNAKRVAIEEQARAARARNAAAGQLASPQTVNPFSQPRADAGGGAMHPMFMLGIFALLMFRAVHMRCSQRDSC